MSTQRQWYQSAPFSGQLISLLLCSSYRHSINGLSSCHQGSACSLWAGPRAQLRAWLWQSLPHTTVPSRVGYEQGIVKGTKLGVVVYSCNSYNPSTQEAWSAMGWPWWCHKDDLIFQKMWIVFNSEHKKKLNFWKYLWHFKDIFEDYFFKNIGKSV